MTSVGVDVDSRSIAIARVDPSSDVATRLLRIKIPSATKARPDILRTLHTLLKAHQDWFTGAVVFVEAPVLAGARNIQSTIKVAGVYGLTLAVVSAWAPVIEVPISSWKKGTNGNGNANKAAVAEWLKATHPHLFVKCVSTNGMATDQNLVDATCIALYGAQLPGDVLTGATAA